MTDNEKYVKRGQALIIGDDPQRHEEVMSANSDSAYWNGALTSFLLAPAMGIGGYAVMPPKPGLASYGYAKILGDSRYRVQACRYCRTESWCG